MILYVDNDVIHKLAAFDLFDAVLASLGATRADIRVLFTAKYKFFSTKPVQGVKRYGAAVHKRIVDFLSSVGVAEDADTSDVDAMQGVLNIEGGELILLSGASRTPGSLLLTGDKRCLEALASSPPSAPVADRLAGRVLCLEQLIEKVVHKAGTGGFDTVRDSIVAEMKCDGSMRAIFSAGSRAEVAKVLDGLRSYIGNLRSTTAMLLMPPEQPTTEHLAKQAEG